MNITEALHQAKFGELGAVELATTRRLLAKPEPDTDLYGLLNVIGFAGDPARDERLVATYLHRPDDPMLAKIAVMNLSLRWALLAEYLPHVRAFVQGVVWDVDQDVQCTALTAAGFALREWTDPDLLADVIRVAVHPETGVGTRQSAVEALHRALGDEAADPPSRTESAKPGSRWFTETVDLARARYRREIDHGRGKGRR
ncbi:hypothetical protein JOF53_001036 [Crossiella equi]|uniref:HEAT repeat domain-containing protein n=1 Tax=Crossiella equi TaxID=130796 RepID=A0ABS5A7F5_9PSEU|nr:hypothetical protein [Crossiella equi]MBP2472164.1 hypothetical protein [Crossiella equi]